MKIVTSLFFMLFALLCNVSAQNPYLPLWEFIPDGEPYVFEDPDNPGKYRVYIYGSHDMLRKYYCGRDQVVWSASVDDLALWRCDGIIFRLDKDRDGNLINANGDGDVLYAPDVCETTDSTGRKVYYLYPNVQSDERGSAVAKSYRPDGPFEVCNWSKDNPRRTVGPISFDPAAFVDDDGRAYAYWGFTRSMAAELDPATMSTVKPGTKVIDNMITGFKDSVNMVYRFFEASSIRKIKDKYVFIYSRWTNEGEDGLPQTNYTLAYCYSNSPLGPWTYGGTIIDGRGKERQPDGSVKATATPCGNTHGSLCCINGKWWVFYHRQAGTSEYSRQAMVAPVEVEVREGEGGYVRISEAEYTSEGFKTEGLDPLTEYQAGIACYYTGPHGARQEFPNMIYSGSHTEVHYLEEYPGYSYDKAAEITNPYAAEINRCPMVNNVDGSVVGYKYYNFSKTYGKKRLRLQLNYEPEGIDGTVDIYIDRPSEQEGGVRIGSLTVKGSGAKAGEPVRASVDVSSLSHYNGKHALYLVFSSKTKGKSVCRLNTLRFSSAD